MKLPNRFQILIALLFFGIVFHAIPAFAATVTFRVADVEAKAGETVEVPITAVGAPGLSAIHLELIFDPNVLTTDTVTRGNLTGNNALVDFNGADPGRVLIGIATLEPIQGDGPLAIVRFKVTGKGGSTTALTLDNCKAWESGSHAEVLIKTEPGKASIQGFPKLLLVAIAIILGILFVIIIILVLLKSRRKTAAQRIQQQTAPAPPAAPGHAFRSAEEKYFQLKGRLVAGNITQQQFETAMKDVMIQDAHGRYWTIDVHTGRWLVYDGQAWLEAQPPS